MGDLVALIVEVAEVVSTMRRGEMESALVGPMNVEVGLAAGNCFFFACLLVLSLVSFFPF